MKIHFYGRLGEILGREMDVSIERACRVHELRTLIAEARPDASDSLHCARARACIADSIVREDHLVAPDDTVEFFPPVSGG